MHQLNKKKLHSIDEGRNCEVGGLKILPMIDEMESSKITLSILSSSNNSNNFKSSSRKRYHE